MTGIIAADEDDWDRYESLHWRAARGVARNDSRAAAGDPRATRGLSTRYLGGRRSLLGWAILFGRKS
jgi:hypothetical protein